MQVIKNIIFDLGGILTGLDRLRCVEAFTRIGAAAVAGYVDECRQEDLFHDLEVGHIGESAFCDAVRRACPSCRAADEAIKGAWETLLTGIPRSRLDMLEALRGRYRLVLLSNTNPIHWRKAADRYFTAAGHDASYYFEKIYLSYITHKLKPGKDAFIHVLSDARMMAGETLLIDDSAANCAAARSLGITATQQIPARLAAMRP